MRIRKQVNLLSKIRLAAGPAGAALTGPFFAAARVVAARPFLPVHASPERLQGRL
jgi:hypothetical protein